MLNEVYGIDKIIAFEVDHCIESYGCLIKFNKDVLKEGNGCIIYSGDTRPC